MDDLEAMVRRQLYRMQGFTEDVARVRAREVSEDGAIAVEVDGNGALRNLEFSGDISRMSPAEFERVLVDTANAAAQQAFVRLSELITELNDEQSQQVGG
ncbi:YbaB/EbfC family nucleoid-associated protein [Nocardia sp. alder85J]|uniref:YbaB/EbfC family nucleoid-associated protein n=1 Tax=Nocardia sp. alder85J TaxID=2862949 RepID=UPI001CD40685|nr:YbaB/EbfC family nucleoid-associated protein [Nocardia sp. alder85J]MCX4093035.1 YbaB/EbfC family nucleoid-associated protein [Nocardia sp. alder85J]